MIASSLRQGRTRRGFTLVELSLVVLILGFVSAVALPRFSNLLRRQRLDAAARLIAADLRYARTHAIMDKTDRQVIFSIADQSYRLPDRKSQRSKTIYANYTQKLSELAPGVRIISVDFGSEGQKATFTRLGTPKAGGQIVIKDNVQTVTIQVSSSSGRVSWSVSG